MMRARKIKNRQKEDALIIVIGDESLKEKLKNFFKFFKINLRKLY